MRLDRLLVERGLVGSREKAQALILARQVLVDGRPAAKPGHAVSCEAALGLLAPLKYVSRGGLKLEAALDHWSIQVRGVVCLDIGASTGGFTDCLLQRGATRVHAVDVGKGQLDWRLRNDPRVMVREGLNARRLEWADIGEAVDLVTCDVSFISATLILPRTPPLLRDGSRMVALAKPQFEAGRGQVGKGGIVRDPRVRAAAVEKVSRAVAALGFRKVEWMECPVTGAEGNREFLVHGWEYSRK